MSKFNALKHFLFGKSSEEKIVTVSLTFDDTMWKRLERIMKIDGSEAASRSIAKALAVYEAALTFPDGDEAVISNDRYIKIIAKGES